MKTIVILTGAGISKESGIDTFRDSKESLWNNHKIEDVATPMAFLKDPGLVLEFYNQRRRILGQVEPNQAHKDLVKLEEHYNVQIITQNVDDLHEKAGSSNIMHLHGSLTEAKTNLSPDEIYNIGYEDINLGDVGGDGTQLRPNVVWFGESVPMINSAEAISKQADIYVIIGTSLEVYPAAGLVMQAKPDVPVYIIDPNKPEFAEQDRLNFIEKPATEGVAELVEKLMADATGEEVPLKVYEIDCEWDMGFARLYSSREKAQAVIDETDWVGLVEYTQEEVEDGNLVVISEIEVR